MNGPLFKVEMKCPVCGVSFYTSRVRSKNCVVESRDSDFCVYYKEQNPVFYEAVVCPKCGYAALRGSFADLDPEEARDILEKTGGKWNGRDLGGVRTVEDALDSYKLALYYGQLKKNTPAEAFASICMRLAWLNRIKGDVKEERRFLAHALEQYMVLYDRGKTPEKMDEVTLIYLIGEINRRLDRGKDAVMWFGRAVSHKGAKQKPLIVKMAREQWSLVRNTGQGE
jgi:uncharacterized protein (DUF2225 family)